MTSKDFTDPVEGFLEVYGRRKDDLLGADVLSAPGVFEAESWPRLLTFQDADGEVRAVRFEGPQVDYLQHCTGVYEKVR